jgi:probable F420-dependent oxidoreductase
MGVNPRSTVPERSGSRVAVRIGASIPTSGAVALDPGIAELARRAERAGFAALWVSDHIVMPTAIESRYPFAADGKATWSPGTPYLDAVVALALMAAATERATIGTAVLVLPLRSPVVFAKQAASIDVASGGRLRLGVGAGWLREEFEALNVPFDDRGRRLVEWLELARDLWSGRPQARSSERYTLPAGVVFEPQPAHDIPVLMGGHSPAALRRAGRVADGWLAQQSLDALDPGELAAGAAVVRAAAGAAGRDPDGCQTVLKIVDSAGRADEVAAALPALAEAGVSEITVALDWASDAAEQYARLSA